MVVLVLLIVASGMLALMCGLGRGLQLTSSAAIARVLDSDCSGEGAAERAERGLARRLSDGTISGSGYRRGVEELAAREPQPAVLDRLTG